jgi:hypothetical protein
MRKMFSKVGLLAAIAAAALCLFGTKAQAQTYGTLSIGTVPGHLGPVRSDE